MEEFNARFYLIEALQQILGVFGDNVIITGLTPKSIVYNPENKILNLKISPGSCVLDRTFIEYPEEIEFKDVFINFSFKYLIAVLSFRYLRTSRLNLSRVVLRTVDNNDRCQDWDSVRDKLILFAIDQNWNIIHSDIFNDRTIVVNDKEYIIYPYNNIINQIRPYLKP